MLIITVLLILSTIYYVASSRGFCASSGLKKTENRDRTDEDKDSKYGSKNKKGKIIEFHSGRKLAMQ